MSRLRALWHDINDIGCASVTFFSNRLVLQLGCPSERRGNEETFFAAPCPGRNVSRKDDTTRIRFLNFGTGMGDVARATKTDSVSPN
jgi:hypothetical protein